MQMITPEEYGRKHGKTRTCVMQRIERIKGVVRTRSERTEWSIPVDAPWPEDKKRGRKARGQQ